jgi:hypothetical protein
LAVAVEGGREGQHMAEKPRHGDQPVAVGHALGLHRQHDVGADTGQADGRPDRQQQLGVADHRMVGHAVRLRQQVDDAAKQHRLAELQRHDDQVGRNQAPGDRAVVR